MRSGGKRLPLIRNSDQKGRDGSDRALLAISIDRRRIGDNAMIHIPTHHLSRPASRKLPTLAGVEVCGVSVPSAVDVSNVGSDSNLYDVLVVQRSGSRDVYRAHVCVVIAGSI
jgi:hypothetical protein